MPIDFDVGRVTLTEFGVGLDVGDDQLFFAVPVNADAQAALREMVATTSALLDADETGPVKYDPSEKHGGVESLYLPLEDELATPLRNLHEAANLEVNASALDDYESMYCYFTRMTDESGRRLTGLRRAAQFKGILKSKLLRFVSDSLRLVEDNVFKLDRDFDVLIDNSTVHILRPSGFEFSGKLQEAILEAVPQNIEAIKKDLPFVEFDSIETYAVSHARAARYLASIQAQKETKNIDPAKLRKLCAQTNVQISWAGGKLAIDPGSELGFLEVLDRRRYEIELVRDAPERFRAASRTKIQ